MSQQKTSKEERFMLKLYLLAKKRGDLEAEVSRYAVGNLVGENTKGVDHTVQLLAKNGFLKKGEEETVYLTSRGIALAEDLL